MTKQYWIAKGENTGKVFAGLLPTTNKTGNFTKKGRAMLMEDLGTANYTAINLHSYLRTATNMLTLQSELESICRALNC
jgi:hypothetical protein